MLFSCWPCSPSQRRMAWLRPGQRRGRSQRPKASSAHTRKRCKTCCAIRTIWIRRFAFRPVGLHNRTIWKARSVPIPVFSLPSRKIGGFGTKLGVLYFRLKAYALSKSYLLAAVEFRDAPRDVRVQVVEFVDAIDQRLAQNRFEGLLATGLRYQTNVNSGSSAEGPPAGTTGSVEKQLRRERRLRFVRQSRCWSRIRFWHRGRDDLEVARQNLWREADVGTRVRPCIL